MPNFNIGNPFGSINNMSNNTTFKEVGLSQNYKAIPCGNCHQKGRPCHK